MLADSDGLGFRNGRLSIHRLGFNRFNGKLEGSRNAWDVRVFDRMYFVVYCVNTDVILGRFCMIIAHCEGFSHRIF